QALSELGVTAEICTTDADGGGRLPVTLNETTIYRGVPTHFFKRDRSEAFKFSKSMKQWLDGNMANYDAVHIYAVFSHATHPAAQAWSKHGVRYVVRPLGTLEPWSLQQKWLRKFVAWHFCFRRDLMDAAAVHYTTRQERELTEQSLNLNKGIVVPN